VDEAYKSSIAIAADGSIYVATTNGHLYCMT
jgi:outer membrane protein assembly factor BamB